MIDQVFGDMSEKFDFDEGAMDYLDGPLSGWLRRKQDGAWFAYDCQPVIAGKLWHWTLVPTSKKDADIGEVLSRASAAKSGSWLSITEDRRASTTSTCRLVSMENHIIAPVLGPAKARRRDA